MKLIINDYDSFCDGSIIILWLNKTIVLNRPQAETWLMEHHCWDREYQMIDYEKIKPKNLPMFDEIILVINGEATLVKELYE